LLYALDRYQYKDELEKKINDSQTVVITNRYTQSNLAFQGAKLEGSEQDHFIKWIEDLESRLPQPSLVIFLDMSPEAAKKLGHESRKYMQGKDTNYDIHEENVSYQEKVRQVYLKLAQKKGWLVVNCAEKQGEEWKLKTPEQIHERVWERVEKMLKWRDG
jgi:dTMP kinase